MVVKAIIFDCFGVLVSSARNIMCQDYPQFRTQIDDIGHQSDYGLINRDEFNKALGELIGMTPHGLDAKYRSESIRDEKTVDMVRKLKSTGQQKIGLLSNVGPSFFELFFNKSFQTELFDDVLLSYEVGIAKPDVALFELAAQRLGVLPDECIMIDDNAVNVDGAINAGMQGIRFITRDQMWQDLQKILESTSA